ncbi:MAG: hypothetical protein KKA42_14095 [candidate division Zixibacteria bacterium]|nr:hypothetical protein [candidate division Zixibacteria bacterium]
MNKPESPDTPAADIVAMFRDDSLSLLDLDFLESEWQNLVAEKDARAAAERELAVLRRDCEQRIAGMIKALAAVDRNRDRQEAALSYLATLRDFDAAALLAEYRRVSARFRDSFPASFAGQRPVGRHHRPYATI